MDDSFRGARPGRKGLLAGIGLACLLLASRLIWPERPPEMTGPRALNDALFAIGLLFWVLLLTGSLGYKVVRALDLPSLQQAELAFLSLVLGLGMFETGIFLFGVTQLWRPAPLLASFVSLMVFTWREWSIVLEIGPVWLRRAWITAARLDRPGKICLGAGLLLLVLVVLQSLAPPWDYDGQMYHLEGPRQFLAAGGIRLLPDLWQANGAVLPDMLYLFGLSLGSDIFVRLAHLTSAGLLLWAVWLVGRQQLGKAQGWLALALMLGIPMFPIWASWAYADMAWALVELAGLWMLMKWNHDRQRSLLATAGLLAGCALGSKYLAAGTLAVWGLGLALASLKDGWRNLVSNVLSFAFPALLVASPWYLKNLLLAGNPVYPFVWGGPGWDTPRLSLLMGFLQSFGAGGTLSDYLRLPLTIFSEHEKFAGFMPQVEIPNPLFLFALLYPFTKRSPDRDILAWFGLARFAIWAAGSQQTRFLLPVFPVLALISSHVLVDLSGRLVAFRLPKLARVIPAGLSGGMVVVTLFYSLVHFVTIQPAPVVLGTESKQAFLSRVVYAYPAWQYIRTRLPQESRTLLLWDGQGYYCGERCIPDPEQSRWAYLVQLSGGTAELVTHLNRLGISHLLYSRGDFEFISQHDSGGLNEAASRFLLDEFGPACTRQEYADRAVVLLQVLCKE